MPIPGKGRTLMRFNHFIAIPVVQRWPSGPEVQQPVLTNRWFYSCPCSPQAGKRPGGWEMMSKTGWDNFKCSAVPSLLCWNVLRTTQYGCFFFWEASAHMTPRLFPRDIYCHWLHCPISLLTSFCILLACLSHSSTNAGLESSYQHKGL